MYTSSRTITARFVVISEEKKKYTKRMLRIEYDREKRTDGDTAERKTKLLTRVKSKVEE